MTYEVTLREFGQGGWISVPIRKGFKTLDSARKFACDYASRQTSYFEAIEVYITGKRQSQGDVFRKHGRIFWRRWGDGGRKVTTWELDINGNLIPHTMDVDWGNHFYR